MSDATLGSPVAPRPRRNRFSPAAWRNRLAASPGFQSWASRNWLTRGIVRREGAAMFDLVAGFVHSQILAALIEFDLLAELLERAETAGVLARRHGLPPGRMEVLLQGGAALGLLTRKGDRFRTSRRGAALSGVPGLSAMIAHHRTLYRDLEDAAAFFRGETDPELAAVWPYVFGEGAAIDPDRARIYSGLMADSQAIVAEETLRAVSFSGDDHVADIGGGSGVFLTALAAAYPELPVTLFDLPEVAPQAQARFAEAGIAERATIRSGSFRSDPLPAGASTLTLVRVLYDHDDATVAALLASAHAALPPGGRVVISEPMSGGARPERAGDAYFAIYTMAMGTGRTRSAAQLMALLKQAGFRRPRQHATRRPFVTSVVSARRP